MLMKNCYHIFLLFAGLLQCKTVFGQKKITFSDFTLNEMSAVTNKKYTTDQDTFIIQRYSLTNREGDSLILFQNMQVKTIGGQVVLYDMGITLSGSMLYKDSCYTLQYESDKDFYTDKDYVKRNRVDFVYISKNGKTLTSNENNNLILISATTGNCNHTLISANYNSAFDSLSKILPSIGRNKCKKGNVRISKAYLGNTMKAGISHCKTVAASTPRQDKFSDSINY